MKIKILILIQILFIILIHCKKNEKDYPKVITIDESKTANVSFTLRKKIELIDIVSPKIAILDDGDKIYVYGMSTLIDKKCFLVKIYNKELEFISQKQFQYGQGPGDVGLTNIISPFMENIYICENSNLRVSIFDSDFNYIKSVKYGNTGFYPFELIDEGRFFVTWILVDKNNREANAFWIGSFPSMKAKEFHITDYYNPYDEKRRFLFGENTEHSFFYKNNFIYLLIPKNYQLLKFNLNGEKVDDLTIKVTEIKTPQKMIPQFLADQGYKGKAHRYTFGKIVTPTSFMVPLRKGFIVTRRKDYSINCNGFTDGDYFSYQMVFGGKVSLPCFYNIFKITLGYPVISTKNGNNFLYLVNEANEDLFLEKWEVSE